MIQMPKDMQKVFHDALADRPEVLISMGDATLKKLPSEPTKKLRPPLPSYCLKRKFSRNMATSPFTQRLHFHSSLPQYLKLAISLNMILSLLTAHSALFPPAASTRCATAAPAKPANDPRSVGVSPTCSSPSNNMPRKIRELISDLRKVGFTLDRHKGSHRQFKHPSLGGQSP